MVLVFAREVDLGGRQHLQDCKIPRRSTVDQAGLPAFAPPVVFVNGLVDRKWLKSQPLEKVADKLELSTWVTATVFGLGEGRRGRRR